MSEFVHLHLHSEYLAARRRVPDRGTARQGRRAEDAGDGDHRARQHVLVGGLPRPGAQARDQSDPRLRGLRGAGRSADQERHAGRDGESPGPAGGDQRGLPQPDQAGVVRLHRRLLLQAAHRQGAARAAREGADRPEQLPEGGGRDRHPHRAAAEGDRRPRRRTATSSGARTSSSRCSIRASRNSRSSTSACSRSRKIWASISSSPTTSTTCRTPTSSRTTSCSASAPARPSTTPSGCAITAISST